MSSPTPISQRPVRGNVHANDPDEVMQDYMEVDDIVDEENVLGATDELPEKTREKLQQVVDMLRHVGWSFRQFILAWNVSRKGSAKMELQHRKYRTIHQRQQLFLSLVFTDLDSPGRLVNEMETN